MSRRKVQRRALQSLLWWSTSIWSSLRSWHWRRCRPDLLRRRENGSLDVSVYRNPTHTVSPLQLRWRTESLWLLDRWTAVMRKQGGEAIFTDHMAINSNFCSHCFIFALMMTGAFSRNINKLFSELKLVTDNLSLYLCSSQMRSH